MKQTIILVCSLLVVLTTLFGVSSCNYSDEWNEVTYKEQYSISFPSYMEAANKLGDKNHLQYVNYFRNIYAIVKDKPKGESFAGIDAVYDKEFADLVSLLKNPRKQGEKTVEVKGALGPAKQFSISGDVGDKDDLYQRIFYRVTIFETPTHLYQIVLWTWYEWRDKYDGEMDRIIDSFQEVK